MAARGSIAIVGAGVIGCACAAALLRRGFAVTVLERSASASEAPGETGVASWGAAGILGAQIAATADGPFARLAVASRAAYPAFVRELEAETGVDVELRPCGVLRPAFTRDELDRFEAAASWHAAAGLRVERLRAEMIAREEPAVAPGAVGALRFPDDARIDPPKLLTALRRAVVARGGELRLDAHVARVAAEDGQRPSVELSTGERIGADVVLLAAGSWSSELEPLPVVEPARGQMIELRLPRRSFGAVIEGADAYLSPRDDGRVLVGSTVELVGFERRVTAGAVRGLLDAAVRMVPTLAGATFHRAWAAFRPRTPDELPRIGAARPGVFVATGHHRNGVLLAPITGAAVAALIAGERPPIDLAPFAIAAHQWH